MEKLEACKGQKENPSGKARQVYIFDVGCNGDVFQDNVSADDFFEDDVSEGDVSVDDIYRKRYRSDPVDVTDKINGIIPSVQAYIKEINRDPQSLPELSSKLLFMVKIAISNGWLRGISTTDAAADRVEYYHEKDATFLKGRAHVGNVSGSYDYELTAFGVGKSGSVKGESGGGTFDFILRIDHKTFALKTTKFRIINYHDVKIILDNLDLSWLTTSNKLKPIIDLVVRQIEKIVIDITNDLYEKGTTSLASDNDESPDVKDFDSILSYLWKVLNRAAKL